MSEFRFKVLSIYSDLVPNLQKAANKHSNDHFSNYKKYQPLLFPITSNTDTLLQI